MWGAQGEVYFDGENYWGTVLIERGDNSNIRDAVNIMWSQETWEERQEVSGIPTKPVEEIKKTKKSKTTATKKKTTKRIKKGETV